MLPHQPPLALRRPSAAEVLPVRRISIKPRHCKGRAEGVRPWCILRNGAGPLTLDGLRLVVLYEHVVEKDADRVEKKRGARAVVIPPERDDVLVTAVPAKRDSQGLS